MNRAYLDTLPEVENRFGVELEEDEKVVFTAKLSTFGTEQDQVLGNGDSTFTMTNKRILANNTAGIWTVDIAEDIAGWRKVSGGALFLKYVYFAIDLNQKVVFDYGKQSLTGFHFYFSKEDTVRFEEIMRCLGGER